MSKILKQQLAIWITTDNQKHFTAEEARKHQQKIDLTKALANFFHKTDISALFGAIDHIPAQQAAEELLEDDYHFKAFLQLVEDVNSAMITTVFELKE